MTKATRPTRKDFPITVEPWPADVARRLERTARNELYTHYCEGHRSEEWRNNCSACILQGYRPRDAEYKRTDGPDCAGWARTYVQTRRIIPPRWRTAFYRELMTPDNPAYVEALKRDIATFGWPAGV